MEFGKTTGAYVYRQGNGRMVVAGVPAGERIAVTSTEGRVVATCISDGSDVLLETGNGVFIVRAGDRILKVVL